MLNPRLSKLKLEPSRHKPSRLPSILIVGFLLLLVGVILLNKARPQADTPPTDDLSKAQLVSTLEEGAPTLAFSDPEDLPETQLVRALADGAPTLAFFHSNRCIKCIKMVETVEQVYPEFSETVVLVDVDVYIGQNGALLQKEKIQFIPTLIFYDRAGQKQVHVGAMEAEELHQTLAALAEGD